MRPLDPLVELQSPTPRLLREAPAAEVAAELERLAGEALAAPAAAALGYARGALALREGRLDDAHAALDGAAQAFGDLGEREAAALARAECWLAAIRRGPRKVYGEAIDALDELAAAHAELRAVWVVAKHYRATAMRYAGQAEQTLSLLLEALKASDGLTVERAQVLNSLGTLYVVMGAYGAASSVLAHAAELNHQVGDRVSEAISFGQLGSAALASGDLEAARRYLQKQEWFASRVGDNFGQARALCMLGDLAIDLGRPDDAMLLGEQARKLAESVTPPLHMWIAYATRTIGRAKIELGAADALDELKSARERFERIGNQLGEALVTWDLAHLAARRGGEADKSRPRWHAAASKLANLGLTARVAQVLQDMRRATSSPEDQRALDLAVAATTQSFPHLALTQEADLVLTEPDTVAVMSTRRIGAQRNLGRIAAHSLARGGMHLAVIAANALGTTVSAVPPRRSAAALIGQLPSLALWAWTREVTTSEIARDLSALRVAAGDDLRALLGWFSEARVASVPFSGELGVDLGGASLAPLLTRVLAAAPASLELIGGVAWDGESEALARMSGFTTVQPS
jgi:tetratricopeptide (TPR) repeat protein